MVRPLGCAKNNPDVGIRLDPCDRPEQQPLISGFVTGNWRRAPPIMFTPCALGSLVDVVPPRLISASQTLSDGSTYEFNAAGAAAKASAPAGEWNCLCGLWQLLRFRAEPFARAGRRDGRRERWRR